jgi:hypothetical protein
MKTEEEQTVIKKDKKKGREKVNTNKEEKCERRRERE